MKKIFTLLLVLVTTAVASAQTRIGGLYYSVNKNQTEATVVPRQATAPYYPVDSLRPKGDVVIPDSIRVFNTSGGRAIYKEVPVTRIADNAFNGCDLSRISMPQLKKIGKKAFYGSNARVINFRASVDSIDDNALEMTHFYYLILPEGLRYVGHEVFRNTPNLRSLSLPKSLTFLGDHFVRNSDQLKIVLNVLDLSQVSLSAKALDSLSADVKIYVHSGMKTKLAAAAGWSKFTNVEEPYDLEKDGLYYKFVDGKAVVVSRTNDPKFPYSEKYADKDIVIPAFVMNPRIGGLVGIFHDVVRIGDYAFYRNQGIKSLTLPEKLTEIGSNAFYGSDLRELTIPNSVTTIGEGAFTASQLRKVVLPAGLKEIEKSVFWDSELKELVLPEGLEKICYQGLSGVLLRTLTLPKSLKIIESSAFGRWGKKVSGEQSIKINTKDPADLTSVIDMFSASDMSRTTLYVPVGSKAKYEAHEHWKNLGLKAIVEDATLGLSSALSSSALAEVRATSGGVSLVLPHQSQVQVYDVAGVRHYGGQLLGGRHELRLPKGVYVVRVGAQTEKVVVSD